jgi:predicted HTH transcriptional regulator
MYTTAEDMAVSFGTTGRNLRRVLLKLKEMGLVRRIGSNKKGKWVG